MSNSTNPGTSFGIDLALFLSDSRFHGVELGATRSVLAARCAVFSAMLYGEMRERDADKVALREIKSNALRAVLLFIYRIRPSHATRVGHPNVSTTCYYVSWASSENTPDHEERHKALGAFMIEKSIALKPNKKLHPIDDQKEDSVSRMITSASSALRVTAYFHQATISTQLPSCPVPSYIYLSHRSCLNRPSRPICLSHPILSQSSVPSHLISIVRPFLSSISCLI
ncbi:hypothetical protein BC936DRAFT_146866 [Jimgerdemannia flammicorona]|uniref:BTB domain-containing protein n=1 Tax=Jimgerdemannia flammicorona TaxID=994334 RepID=A0A433DLE5_9FUNG|nr:hypothetical protein BC936DRAFT_146866 [Jimgerdemannia flammicorona]